MIYPNDLIIGNEYFFVKYRDIKKLVFLTKELRNNQTGFHYYKFVRKSDFDYIYYLSQDKLKKVFKSEKDAIQYIKDLEAIEDILE